MCSVFAGTLKSWQLDATGITNRGPFEQLHCATRTMASQGSRAVRTGSKDGMGQGKPGGSDSDIQPAHSDCRASTCPSTVALLDEGC